MISKQKQANRHYIGIFTDTPYHKNDISGVIVKCNSLLCLVILWKTMDKTIFFPFFYNANNNKSGIKIRIPITLMLFYFSFCCLFADNSTEKNLSIANKGKIKLLDTRVMVWYFCWDIIKDFPVISTLVFPILHQIVL